MAPELAKVEEHFKKDTNVVFVSVSVDTDKQKWLNSVKQGKYATTTSTHVYTGGQGREHPFMQHYEISGYPSFLSSMLLVIYCHHQNVLIQTRDCSMTALIEKELARMKDGPYVFEENGSKVAYAVNGTVFSKSTAGILTVFTDQAGKTFSVPLQKQLSNELSVSARPEN